MNNKKCTNLILHDHPLIQDKLGKLRCPKTSPKDFRSLLYQISAMMVYKITLNFELTDIKITTPLEKTLAKKINQTTTLVPILRAGMGMIDGMLSLLPEASVGHIGIYRNESSKEPIEYYSKLPSNINQSQILLIDPMLATGGSASHATTILKNCGCTNVHFVCLIASPEGVLKMNTIHPSIPIHTASLDKELDENGYIRPGLGDAGDRIFGTF